MLEAIWAHAKNVVKEEQEETCRQRDAAEDARNEALRRYYLNLTLANDDDLDLPRAA